MSHTDYIERCPYCGKIYYYERQERRRYFGKPELVCPNKKCGKKFFDRRGYEWENLTNDEKKSVLMYSSTDIGIQDGIHIFTEKELKSQIRDGYIFSGFLIGIPALVKNKKILNQWNSFKFDPSLLEHPAIQESIKRTSDPEYREFLLNMGKNFYGADYEDK